MNTKKGGNK